MRSHVVVTGAASGLGRLLVRTLLAAGRPVVVVDRDERQARATAEDLGARHGIPVPVVVADLGSVPGVEGAAEELVGRYAVGGLVNNAGAWSPGDQYPDAAPQAWLSTVTLNLLAPMLLTQRLWPLLAAASGAVVNIGSSGGTGDEGYGSPEYGATKAGIRRLTAALGSRPQVRVTAVVPGWIGLERAHRQWAALSPDEQRDAGPLIPPQQVVDTVVRLLDHGRPGEVVEMP